MREARVMFSMDLIGLAPRLIEAMQIEANARRYYGSLIKYAEHEEDIEFIGAFLKEEEKIFNRFYSLYIKIVGEKPTEISFEELIIKSYYDGIRKAIINELKAYEIYRDVYLSQSNSNIKNIFFEAFTDKNKHALMLNCILAGEKMKISQEK